MEVSIRAVTDVQGCEHVMEIIRQVWGGLPDIINIPVHVLYSLALRGGVMLAAYADDGPPELDGMVAVILGWLGTSLKRGDPADAPPRLILHSHLLAVLPPWQRQQIGLRLKLAQREAVLAQGLTDLMDWTFDPLISRNARFNLHRLGATTETYQRDFMHEYGDRFWVDWHLRSPNIMQDIATPRPVTQWDIGGLKQLPVTRDNANLDRPVDYPLELDDRPLAVPVPTDIVAIRSADAALVLDWTLYQRAIFEPAFAAGYTVVDCIDVPAHGPHYILVGQG